MYWQQSEGLGLDLFCHYFTYLVPVNASSDLLLHMEVLTGAAAKYFWTIMLSEMQYFSR